MKEPSRCVGFLPRDTHASHASPQPKVLEHTACVMNVQVVDGGVLAPLSNNKLGGEELDGTAAAQGTQHWPNFSARRHSASQLTRRIKSSTDWRELQQLHAEHRKEMDFIHMSATVTHLAQLEASSDQSLQNDGSQANQKPGKAQREWLVHVLLPDIVAASHLMRAREAANVAWALAKLLQASGAAGVGVFWQQVA